MKILFATTNPSKVRYYAEELREVGYDILTIKDLNLEIDVEEDEKTPVENAIKKAKAYYEVTGIKSIAIDDGLFIEGLDEARQPRNEVRRVNGKRLTDEEMLAYYTNIVKELGGKVKAKWVKGIAIYDGSNCITFEKSSERIFVDKVSKVVNEGYPLDSITYWEQFEKYTSELSNADLKELKKENGENVILDFMRDNL